MVTYSLFPGSFEYNAREQLQLHFHYGSTLASVCHTVIYMVKVGVRVGLRLV